MFRRLMKKDKFPVLIILMMTGMWLLLDLYLGKSFYGPSPFNSYTLQALSWLQGHAWVENNPALELAIYEGKYYVSFPPLPSVILLPFAAIFGRNTPDNLLIKVYAAMTVLFLYGALKKVTARRADAAFWSFLAVFSSCFLPLTVEGAVWYQAQALALMLATGAVYLLTRDCMTGSLLMYALSVAARPFDALYFFPIFGVWLILYRRAGIPLSEAKGKIIPGFALGLLVAVCIGLYNYFRFGNPFEFGHNYLPEFSFQGGVQFSLSHVLNNINGFVLRLPFYTDWKGIHLEKFGFTFLAACPVLALMLVWFIEDVIRRRMDAARGITAAVFLIHFFLLLTHRTFGGYQFGARYCVDLLPYAFLYRLLRKEKKKTPVWEWIVFAIGWAFSMYGSVMIHL